MELNVLQLAIEPSLRMLFFLFFLNIYIPPDSGGITTLPQHALAEFICFIFSAGHVLLWNIHAGQPCYSYSVAAESNKSPAEILTVEVELFTLHYNSM